MSTKRGLGLLLAIIQEDRRTLAEIKDEITLLTSRLQELEEQDFLISYGFYESKYNFGTSEEYKEKLETIKTKQKEKIKNKAAAVCHNVTLDEIVETVKDIAREETWDTKIRFTKVAEAEEYRKTVAMKK